MNQIFSNKIKIDSKAQIFARFAGIFNELLLFKLTMIFLDKRFITMVGV